MVPFLEFDIFKPYLELTAAFSTKKGGVSQGMYESLNLSLSSADDPDNILENYRRFGESLGISPEEFVISNQQHTTNIRIAEPDDCGKGLFKERDYDAVDGFITNCKDVAICLLFADCVPVYLYDPVKHVIALVHSGWKGTVGQISGKAVSLMQSRYGSRPENLLAAIGPSICQDCYEVSSDLLFAFDASFNGTGQAGSTEEACMKGPAGAFFRPGRMTDEGERKYQLSLWRAILYTLRSAGVKNEHICNPEICTCCEHDLFFSHRYTKGKRGNLAAVMVLR